VPGPGELGVGATVGVGLGGGVGVGARVGVGLGVGARVGVAVGRAVGFDVGFDVGAGLGERVGVGALVGDVEAVGMGSPPLAPGVGPWAIWSDEAGDALDDGGITAPDGSTEPDGLPDGVAEPLAPGSDAVAVGLAAGAAEPAAMPSFGRGAKIPAVSATLARTRFRTPIATTRRARCAEVTV
jgi:hypothetical protein